MQERDTQAVGAAPSTILRPAAFSGMWAVAFILTDARDSREARVAAPRFGTLCPVVQIVDQEVAFMPASPEIARGFALVHAADAETLAGDIGAIRLLLDSSHTGGALSTQRVTLRDGADGAPPHHHKRSTELFFALSGEAQLLAGETITTLGAGDTIAIAPQVTHAFGAVPGRDTDLLIVIAPGVERFEYFRQLAQIMVGALPADSLLAEQQRYDTYFDESAAWTARAA